MRKIIFVLFIAVTSNVFGQVAPPPQQQQQQQMQQQERSDFIVVVQMGTDTLKNGEITVNLTTQTIDEMKQANASPNYTVMLTPRGECGQLTLWETTAANFKVKQQKGSAASKGIFDYVVYAKQKRPFMPMRPKPPGAPQPPAPPAPPAGQPAPPQQQ